MRKAKGFTLVELMIVMVIIGILLSLLLPGVFTAQKSAVDTQTASNLRQIGIALFAYAKDNNGTLPKCAADALDDVLVTDYLDDASVFLNGDGIEMNYKQITGPNLYALTSGTWLMADDDTNGSNQCVCADGHVAVSN
ncbi:MAG: type II secretion system protein [Candidatus Omnitrophica bacterium]|nr:type II secretion system protein [Candidatus Omnitrophota bacterium]